MKFNLKEQIISPDLIQVVARQKKGRDLDPYRLSQKQKRQLGRVKEEIEKSAVPRHLAIKNLKGMGRGVFLKAEAKPIEKGTLIAPYAGLVSIMAQNQPDDADYAFDPVSDLLLTREEQKKHDPKAKFHPRRRYALKLDAEKVGNFTRFVNHSSKPNAVAHLVSTKENPYQIIFFAKKKISPGEQILICYEEDIKSYWAPYGIKPEPVTPKTYRVDRRNQCYKIGVGA